MLNDDNSPGQQPEDISELKLNPNVWCVVCGSNGNVPIVLPHLPQLDALLPWRCKNCFRMVEGTHLYCSNCGSNQGNPFSEICRGAYAAEQVTCFCPVKTLTSPATGMNDIKHIVWAYMLILLPVLVGFAISLHSKTSAEEDLVISGIFYLVAMIFVVINWRRILPLFRLPQKAIAASILIPFLATPVTVVLAMAQEQVFPVIKSLSGNYSDAYLEAGFGWGVVFFAIAFCPAFFEELFFRGVLMHRLFNVMPAFQAIVVTAIMFGILHLSAISTVFFLVPMALIAGWLTLRSGSILPAMLLHFLHNATIVSLEWIENQ